MGNLLGEPPLEGGSALILREFLHVVAQRFSAGDACFRERPFLDRFRHRGFYPVVFVHSGFANPLVHPLTETLAVSRADHTQIAQLWLAVPDDDLVPVIVDGVTETHVPALQNGVRGLDVTAKTVLYPLGNRRIVVIRSDEVRDCHTVGW